MAADDRQISLEAKLLSLEKDKLIEFPLLLKIDKPKVEEKSKEQILKEIRSMLESNLATLEGDDDKASYLNGLILSLDTETDDNGTKTIQEQTEVQNLEKELKELEIKRKIIENKLLSTKNLAVGKIRVETPLKFPQIQPKCL